MGHYLQLLQFVSLSEWKSYLLLFKLSGERNTSNINEKCFCEKWSHHWRRMSNHDDSICGFYLVSNTLIISFAPNSYVHWYLMEDFSFFSKVIFFRDKKTVKLSDCDYIFVFIWWSRFSCLTGMLWPTWNWENTYWIHSSELYNSISRSSNRQKDQRWLLKSHSLVKHDLWMWKERFWSAAHKNQRKQSVCADLYHINGSFFACEDHSFVLVGKGKNENPDKKYFTE